ncbi:hypothetical protein NM688_g2830 [Phlebia brevispora]|uniref:Uncharacterized protein n=1 Tax=Phlebia brevispora TaxID=194682 RepID=A0ACC1T778_9APHY|nr:hypothetical protein NM688_g2830 [Phlebia brevispora]
MFPVVTIAIKMAPVKNGKLLFASIPTEYPEPGKHTVYDDSEVIDLHHVPLKGGILIKVIALSIDPYLRNRMKKSDDTKHFPPPFILGEPLENVGVGRVLRSEHTHLKPGQHVYGMLPFQEYTIKSNTQGFRVIENKERLPWTVYTGVLGLAGQTAWYGWKEYASPKKGETAFVTSGAGAVGSFVIQLAKQAGMKVIACAGSDDKVEYMRSLGADVPFNYKTQSTADILEREGPIDIYWDNVGGEIFDPALQNAAHFARFIECGAISDFSPQAGHVTISRLLTISNQEIKLYGFLVTSLSQKYEEAFYREVTPLIAQGRIKYSEDVTEGLAYAGHALKAIQMGANKVVPIPAWGHARPLTGLVARIAHARPIIITYFVPKYLYHRVDTELSRSFEPVESSLRARIRLVGVASEEDNHIETPSFYNNVMEAFSRLLKEEPVTSLNTDLPTEVVRPPTAAILDLFAYSVSNYIRKTGNTNVTLYAFIPCAAFAVYNYIQPVKHLIEQGDLRQQLDDIARETGKSLGDVCKELFIQTSGQVVNLPGLPPLYDYENFPQEVRCRELREGPVFTYPAGVRFVPSMTRPTVARHRRPVIDLCLDVRHLVSCDNLIVSAPQCFEAQAGAQSLVDWLAKTSRRLYSIGPLLPLETSHAADQEKKLSADAVKIDEFMNNTLRSRGSRSMVFMSFGSLFWPVDPSKLYTFIDVMLDRRIPFILSHGARGASMPDDLRQRVHDAGLGLLTSWAPQQTILSHPVTAWFVTHCGLNSAIESISAGVPMVCWPFRAEQPLNTTHMTETLDIAYELFEVRTGPHASKPAYRTGRPPVGTLEALRAETNDVFEKAFGEDGERKRANTMKLRQATLEAWSEKGPSRLAIECLVDDLHTGL